MGNEDDRGRGQIDATARALGEPHPDLALQGGELLGNGRRRVAERRRGRGYRPVRADGVQDPEPANIKHEAQLSIRWQFCN